MKNNKSITQKRLTILFFFSLVPQRSFFIDKLFSLDKTIVEIFLKYRWNLSLFIVRLSDIIYVIYYKLIIVKKGKQDKRNSRAFLDRCFFDTRFSFIINNIEARLSTITVNTTMIILITTRKFHVIRSNRIIRRTSFPDIVFFCPFESWTLTSAQSVYCLALFR